MCTSEFEDFSALTACHKSSINLIRLKSYRFNVRLFRGIEFVVLELTHVYVLFCNSHLANDFNFNVNGPVRVEVEVYVDFATSLLTIADSSRAVVSIWHYLTQVGQLSVTGNI